MLQLAKVCGVNYIMLAYSFTFFSHDLMYGDVDCIVTTGPVQNVPALKCPRWNNHGKSYSFSAIYLLGSEQGSLSYLAK